jgi:hypothetical protein
MCTIHPPKISTAMRLAASLRIIKQKLPVSPSLQPEVRMILASECGYHRTTTRENNRKQTRDRKKEDPKKLDPKSALPEQEKLPSQETNEGKRKKSAEQIARPCRTDTRPPKKSGEDEMLGISLTGTASKQIPWNSQTDWSNAPPQPKS